jgi:hypothetical protein
MTNTNQSSGDELLHDWEGYPMNLSDTYPHEDLEASHRRLKTDANRLFSSQNTDIWFETISPSEGSTNNQPSFFSDHVTAERMLDDVLIVRIPRREYEIVLILKETLDRERRPLYVSTEKTLFATKDQIHDYLQEQLYSYTLSRGIHEWDYQH